MKLNIKRPQSTGESQVKVFCVFTAWVYVCWNHTHTRSAHLTWKAASVSLCWSTQLWKARSVWVRWLNYGYPTNLASGSGGISVLHTLTKAAPCLLCLDKTHRPSSASGDDPGITKEMLLCRAQDVEGGWLLLLWFIGQALSFIGN